MLTPYWKVHLEIKLLERGACCWRILEGGAKLCCHCKVDDSGKHNRSAGQETDCDSINLFLELQSLCCISDAFLRIESLACFIKNITFCKNYCSLGG